MKVFSFIDFFHWALIWIQNTVDIRPHTFRNESLCNKIRMGFDDGLYTLEFAHHLLMVTVALGCWATSYSVAHNHINFDTLFLFVGKIEKLTMLDEEIDVFTLFHSIPVVQVFCRIFGIRFGSLGFRNGGSIEKFRTWVIWSSQRIKG